MRQRDKAAKSSSSPRATSSRMGRLLRDVFPSMSLPGTELPAAPERHTKAIVVVDVVESVRLMEQGEDEFIQRGQQFVRRARDEVLARFGGRLHKSMRDGLM